MTTHIDAEVECQHVALHDVVCIVVRAAGLLKCEVAGAAAVVIEAGVVVTVAGGAVGGRSGCGGGHSA